MEEMVPRSCAETPVCGKTVKLQPSKSRVAITNKSMLKVEGEGERTEEGNGPQDEADHRGEQISISTT